MTDSSHGYEVSTGYNYGFIRETGADWLDLCARLAGFAPRRSDGSYRYLELGSGQGVGVCLLAAANPEAEFLGIDLLPEHIAHAKGLAGSAGLTNVRFIQADFLDLADAWPEDFGEFDYVTLHGVYSWVSPAVRDALVKCLTRATRPGSLVYNGYNTQPGWLATMPFQHITRLLKTTTGRTGKAVFEDSFALFDQLHAAGARTFNALPGLKAQIDSVKTRKTDYLVHEYLHDNWQPSWHSEVAAEFKPADLHYVGSATIVEAMLPDLLPAPLRDAIRSQADQALRQDLQDFVLNQSFRRDIFCRGGFLRSAGARRDLEETRLHLVFPPEPGASLEIKVAFGSLSIPPAGFADVVEALAAGPMSIREIAALPRLRTQGMEQTLQLLILLLQERVLAIAGTGPGSAGTAQRLNARIARAATRGLAYDHIAACEIGSATPATSIQLMLLDSWLRSDRHANAAALADDVLGRTKQSGPAQREVASLPGGNPRHALTALARKFLDLTLPRWRKLGAIE